jgi:dipeptidyl-peptidase-4
LELRRIYDNFVDVRKPDVFKVGVAGGPVVDWKWYEIMYGERYMDTPAENQKGFDEASVLNYVKDLKGKLLLIHGTNDDVVVEQHNLSLVKKFVEAGKQVDYFPLSNAQTQRKWQRQSAFDG